MIGSNTAILLDGNWLLHRAYHTIGKRSAIPTKRVPLQILSWFYEYAVRWNAKFGMIAFDGPEVFRYKVYPKYKASRKEKSDSSEVYESLEHVKSLFSMVGVTVVHEDEYEADDVLVSVGTQWSSDENNRTIVINKDKDAYGYLKPNMKCWTPPMTNSAEVLVDEAYVQDKYGMSSRQFRDFQLLIGDKIDDIPAILSLVDARDLIVEHGSLKSFFATEAGKDFFAENKKKLVRNKKLVGMVLDCVDVKSMDLRIPRPMALDLSMVINDYGPLPKSASAFSSVMAKKKTLF